MSSSNPSRTFRFFFRGAAVFCAVYGLVFIAIVADGFQDHLFRAELIAVLGNNVEPDGTPSGRLQARLDRALEMFRQNQAPLIFVSGGVDKRMHDEAAIMAEYLIQRGVPSSAIIRDHFGINTAATAKDVRAYMDAHRLGSVLISTQYFHIARTKLAFRRAGIRKIGWARARYFERRDFYSTAREVVGYAWYLCLPAENFSDSRRSL